MCHYASDKSCADFSLKCSKMRLSTRTGSRLQRSPDPGEGRDKSRGKGKTGGKGIAEGGGQEKKGGRGGGTEEKGGEGEEGKEKSRILAPTVISKSRRLCRTTTISYLLLYDQLVCVCIATGKRQQRTAGNTVSND